MEFTNFNTSEDWTFFEISENESFKATRNGIEIPQDLLASRKEDLKRFIANDNFLVNILTENNETFGIIIAGVHQNDTSSIGFIYNIYISDNYRNKGYGTMAMNKAIEFCKSKNCNKIALNVGATNTEAIKIYKRIGFQTTTLSMELPLD